MKPTIPKATTINWNVRSQCCCPLKSCTDQRSKGTCQMLSDAHHFIALKASVRLRLNGMVRIAGPRTMPATAGSIAMSTAKAPRLKRSPSDRAIRRSCDTLLTPLSSPGYG